MQWALAADDADDDDDGSVAVEVPQHMGQEIASRNEVDSVAVVQALDG